MFPFIFGQVPAPVQVVIIALIAIGFVGFFAIGLVSINKGS